MKISETTLRTALLHLGVRKHQFEKELEELGTDPCWDEHRQWIKENLAEIKPAIEELSKRHR